MDHGTNRGFAMWALAVGVLAWAPTAVASQCSGIEKNASNVTVLITPETPCIEVAVTAPGCGDSVAVEITNACAAPITLPEPFVCAEGCPLPVGATDRAFPPGEENRLDVVYLVQLEGSEIEIRIGADVETTLPEEDDATAGGCSASAGSDVTGASGWVALALLGLAATRRRDPNRLRTS